MSEPARRFRLDLAYEGTGFSGWAKQPELRTVQGVLESALSLVFHSAPPFPALTVAGRTDTGVHASGQVAHLDLTSEQCAVLTSTRDSRTHNDPAWALQRRLNAVVRTAGDVVVLNVTEVPSVFDARFSALWRRYEYRIADRLSVRDPLQRHRTAWVQAELDVDVMNHAAGTLCGLRDFASFCKAREGTTTIRSLMTFSWERDAEGVAIGTVVADAFCHSMVRALVGACVAVGTGALESERLENLRDARERTSAFRVMPALGLTLCAVGYPNVSELARRAEQTRGLRQLPSL